MLIRKKLTADEFSSPFLRYDATCDCVQFTPDGGETWIDQPSNDPRTSDAYRLPALTGSDIKCRAAEGMTTLVRYMVDERIATDTAIELAGSILGIVAFIPGFNVLWALILAFASFAVTIAREILEAAFTETDYDQIRCIFFCNIGEDGQMNAAQFDKAYAALIDLNSIARTWCQYVFNTFGYVGLSDAGVKLEGAADCDECECDWCIAFDFTTSDGGFVTLISLGEWVSGQGWKSIDTTGGTGPVDALYIQLTLAEAAHTTGLKIWWTGGGSDTFNVAARTSSWGAGANTNLQADVATPGDLIGIDQVGAGYLTLSMEQPRVPALTVSRMEWYGTGAKPVEGEECE